jgi:hypothetical protein
VNVTTAPDIDVDATLKPSPDGFVAWIVIVGLAGSESPNLERRSIAKVLPMSP